MKKQSLFFAVVICLWIGSVVSVRAATLSLVPASGTFLVGSTITVDILLHTESTAIDGVDVYALHYDPTLLQVVDEDVVQPGIQIQIGALMPNTVAATVEPTNGFIRFSQVVTGGTSFSNAVPQMVGRVRFTVLSSGNANLFFNSVAGNTGDTNVAGGGTDVLTSAAGASYVLTSGTPYEYIITNLSTTSYRLGFNSSYTSLAQSFVAPASQLHAITVGLIKNNNPSYPITISLRSSLQGTPLFSGTIQPSQVTSIQRTNPTWITVSAPSPIPLISGNTYYVVLTTATTNKNNFYRWPTNDTNPYPNGSFYKMTSLQANNDGILKLTVSSGAVASAGTEMQRNSTSLSSLANIAEAIKMLQKLIEQLQAQILHLQVR